MSTKGSPTQDLEALGLAADDSGESAVAKFGDLQGDWTVGLIGLTMGIGYVAFGRNLWPLITAHCILNTLSMLDRV